MRFGGGRNLVTVFLGDRDHVDRVLDDAPGPHLDRGDLLRQLRLGRGDVAGRPLIGLGASVVEVFVLEGEPLVVQGPVLGFGYRCPVRQVVLGVLRVVVLLHLPLGDVVHHVVKLIGLAGLVVEHDLVDPDPVGAFPVVQVHLGVGARLDTRSLPVYLDVLRCRGGEVHSDLGAVGGLGVEGLLEVVAHLRLRGG